MGDVLPVAQLLTGPAIFDTLLFETCFFFGSFMVKQDFINNPVIGMSTAAGNKTSPRSKPQKRRVCADALESHLATGMKYSGRLMTRITKGSKSASCQGPVSADM